MRILENTSPLLDEANKGHEYSPVIEAMLSLYTIPFVASLINQPERNHLATLYQRNFPTCSSNQLTLNHPVETPRNLNNQPETFTAEPRGQATI